MLVSLLSAALQLTPARFVTVPVGDSLSPGMQYPGLGESFVVEARYLSDGSNRTWRSPRVLDAKISMVVVNGSGKILRFYAEDKLTEYWAVKSGAFQLYGPSKAGGLVRSVSTGPARGQSWIDEVDMQHMVRLLLTAEPVPERYSQELNFDVVNKARFKRAGSFLVPSEIYGEGEEFLEIVARPLTRADSVTHFRSPTGEDPKPTLNDGCSAQRDVGSSALWAQLLAEPERIPIVVPELIWKKN